LGLRHGYRFDCQLDKVLDINQLTVLKGVREHLQPGGLIAIAHQPKDHGENENDTIKAGERISQRLSASGFQEIQVQLRRMNPVASVCVIGKNLA